jgi:hypothetical protein
MLSNVCQTAWLLESDYQRLVAAYGTNSWFLNKSGNGYAYVRTVHGGNNVQIARLILGLKTRANIRLKDGNPLNLRRSNLELSKGDHRMNPRRKRQEAPLSSLRIPTVARDV